MALGGGSGPLVTQDRAETYLSIYDYSILVFRMVTKTQEENAKFALAQWIESPNTTVLWEKKNAFGKPVFECNRAERPDLIIHSPRGDIAVEVKSATSMANVIDGMGQLLRYATGDLEFSYDGEKLNPVCYVLATECSPMGKLFAFEKKFVPRSEGKNYAAQQGQIPLNEYRYTHMALRTLWRFCDNEVRSHGWIWSRGMGFLLSGLLNSPNDISPMIQAKLAKTQYIRGI